MVVNNPTNDRYRLLLNVAGGVHLSLIKATALGRLRTLVMKHFISKLAMLVILFAGFSTLGHAQSITGVANYDGSYPTLNHSIYWSIYGSNLSTGSGSAQVYFVWGEWISPDYSSLKPLGSIYTSSNCCYYWYESSSQINFLPQLYTDGPNYSLTGTAYIYVCVSGLCSNNTGTLYMH